MTTPHSLILAELTKYRGGEFAPRHLSTMLLVYDTDLGWWAWRSETRGDQCDIEDAHVHIELAAIKMLHRAGEVWMPKSLTPDALLAAVRGINAKENV